MMNMNNRIAVIGNASPQSDISELVDSADIVMRFNSCPHFQSGKTGNRTSIHCVRSFGGIGEKFANGAEEIDSGVTTGCHTVWFVGEQGGWVPKIITRFALGKKQHVHFSSSHMHSVDVLLRKFGGADQGASLGTMATIFLLSRPEFKHYDIQLFCFDLEGWHGHPWKQETRLLMYHQYRKK